MRARAASSETVMSMLDAAAGAGRAAGAGPLEPPADGCAPPAKSPAKASN